MRNELITFRNSVLAGMLCLVAASCSDDAGVDNRLPEGKYPITFSAAVDGLAVSRATSEGSWDGTEKVAIQIGEEVKQYELDADGNLSAIDEDNVFYWQNTDDITVNAWYPYNGGTKPDVVVKANQNEEGNYQASDYLEAKEDAVVKFQNPELTFYHRTAKVSVTLKESESVPDVSGATVGFINQDGVEGVGTEVIPKKETADGNVTTYTALLAPKQMQNQQFIKVTLGDFDYFYTPTKEDDADLEAGKLYTYKITVKKEGLSVTAEKSVSWDEKKLEIKGTPTKATFRVYLPESHGLIADNITGATPVADASNVYEIRDNANSFSISYTPTSEDKAKGFLIANGLGECKRTVEGNTYTFNYSNIRSDLRLSYTFYPEVGDYYYSDGTCLPPPLNKGGSATCIGIVFKVGVGEGDGVSNYPPNTFVDDVIHGYVVALNNTPGRNKDLWGSGISEITLSKDMTLFLGYANTVKIKEQFGTNLSTMSWACDQAVNYGPATPVAPAQNSGWYLPSLGEYNALWQVYGTVNEKFTEVDGTNMNMNRSGLYWTSSKEPTDNGRAAYVPFLYCNGENSFYTYQETNTKAYVRPVLTF